MVPSDVGEFGLDDVESFGPPAVLDFPSQFRGELFPMLPDVGFAAWDGIFSASDVAFEPVDPVEQRGFVVAAPAAELGEATEFGQFPAGVVKPPDRFFPVLEGVGELPLGVAKVGETLGRAGGQDRLMFGPFSEELARITRVYVDKALTSGCFGGHRSVSKRLSHLVEGVHPPDDVVVDVAVEQPVAGRVGHHVDDLHAHG